MREKFPILFGKNLLGFKEAFAANKLSTPTLTCSQFVPVSVHELSKRKTVASVVQFSVFYFQNFQMWRSLRVRVSLAYCTKHQVSVTADGYPEQENYQIFYELVLWFQRICTFLIFTTLDFSVTSGVFLFAQKTLFFHTNDSI